MNLDQLDRRLQTIAVPDAVPGVQRDALRDQLVTALSAGPKRTGRGARPRTVLLSSLVVLALVGASAPVWVPRIITTYNWSENDWLATLSLNGLASEYHPEARNLWARGCVSVLDRVRMENGATCYKVEMVFHDGFRYRFNTGMPPEPQLREELRRLVENGEGRVASTQRQESGLVSYCNLYKLSNGEEVGIGAGFPPMSRDQLAHTQQLINQQTAAGEGIVVGRLKDQYTVEYRLPDGRPFTTVQATAPALLTEAREAEIFEIKSRGGGRLVQHGFTSFGDAYVVEYTLSDGTVFRTGQERPPMTDALWASLREEVQALYGAGHYERATVQGADDTSVSVLVFTMADGQRFDVADVPASRGVWGLD